MILSAVTGPDAIVGYELASEAAALCEGSRLHHLDNLITPADEVMEMMMLFIAQHEFSDSDLAVTKNI